MPTRAQKAREQAEGLRPGDDGDVDAAGSLSALFAGNGSEVVRAKPDGRGKWPRKPKQTGNNTHPSMNPATSVALPGMDIATETGEGCTYQNRRVNAEARMMTVCASLPGDPAIVNDPSKTSANVASQVTQARSA